MKYLNSQGGEGLEAKEIFEVLVIVSFLLACICMALLCYGVGYDAKVRRTIQSVFSSEDPTLNAVVYRAPTHQTPERIRILLKEPPTPSKIKGWLQHLNHRTFFAWKPVVGYDRELQLQRRSPWMWPRLYLESLPSGVRYLMMGGAMILLHTLLYLCLAMVVKRTVGRRQRKLSVRLGGELGIRFVEAIGVITLVAAIAMWEKEGDDQTLAQCDDVKKNAMDYREEAREIFEFEKRRVTKRFSSCHGMNSYLMLMKLQDDLSNPFNEKELAYNSFYNWPGGVTPVCESRENGKEQIRILYDLASISACGQDAESDLVVEIPVR